MLVEGGVDRYALPERVRASVRDTSTPSSARGSTRSGARCASGSRRRAAWNQYLLTRGLAAAIEDLLIARIPLAPAVLRSLVGEPLPPFDDVERLGEEESPRRARSS